VAFSGFPCGEPPGRAYEQETIPFRPLPDVQSTLARSSAALDAPAQRRANLVRGRQRRGIHGRRGEFFGRIGFCGKV
jgi:hypothetical protein